MGEVFFYEVFCMGGFNLICGWYDCDFVVLKVFSEFIFEYCFLLISIIFGEVFMDVGIDFGIQKDVFGKFGLFLDKDGFGVFVGIGVIVIIFVGLICLEVVIKDFLFDYCFNLGVGWKFQ